MALMWTDELFDEIQKGDKVWYENEQGQTCKGKAGRSIVEDLGVDTEDPLHSAIEASQTGSQSMKDNFKPQDVVSYENHTTTSCGF